MITIKFLEHAINFIQLFRNLQVILAVIIITTTTTVIIIIILVIIALLIKEDKCNFNSDCFEIVVIIIIKEYINFIIKLNISFIRFKKGLIK